MAAPPASRRQPTLPRFGLHTRTSKSLCQPPDHTLGPAGGNLTLSGSQVKHRPRAPLARRSVNQRTNHRNRHRIETVDPVPELLENVRRRLRIRERPVRTVVTDVQLSMSHPSP